MHVEFCLVKRIGLLSNKNTTNRSKKHRLPIPIMRVLGSISRIFFGSSGIWSDGLICAIPIYGKCLLSTIPIKSIFQLLQLTDLKESFLPMCIYSLQHKPLLITNALANSKTGYYVDLQSDIFITPNFGRPFSFAPYDFTFSTIFATIPLVSFPQRSGYINSAPLACFPRIKKSMGTIGCCMVFEICESKSTTFRGCYRVLASSKWWFY